MPVSGNEYAVFTEHTLSSPGEFLPHNCVVISNLRPTTRSSAPTYPADYELMTGANDHPALSASLVR